MDFRTVLNMKHEKASDLIPDQHAGKAIDAESEISLNSEQDAKEFFSEVKRRLQNVNGWKEYAGDLLATFQVVDKDGHEVQREVRKGDYLKIDVLGPGSKAGMGYDWVQIEEVVGGATPTSESFGFRVRPTDNPLGDKEGVAHFYSHESTSTFLVQRAGNKITASVHDRNTTPNTDAEDGTDRIRDAAMGAVGATVFSKLQWKNLAEGLLKES